MTTGILKSIEARDILYHQQLGTNDVNLIRAYRRKRNQVRRIVEKAKNLDLLNSFKNIVNNPKKSVETS